jgi:DNA-binding MarR family transcriptional regulator
MNGFDISTYFLEYIEGELIAGNTELANEILKDYHDNFGDSTNYYLQLRYKGAEAMLLASSDRFRDKFQAQNLFENLLEEGIDDFNIKIISHVYLIELLITEYKATEKEEILTEIKKHIKGIEEIANSQNSHRLIAKAMVLEAQLKIFQGEPSNTKYLLNKAYEITEEYNLFNLAIQISLLYDNLFVKIDKEPTDSKINFLPNKFFKSDDISPMESEREICLFYVNETRNLQILREFSLDNIYHGSNTKMILKNLEEEYQKSEDQSAYRFTFNDYKVIILQDEHPQLGYIFIGDTYFAIKKLEAFNEVLRFYLQTKYENQTNYHDQQIIDAVNDILVGSEKDSSFMEATGEDIKHISQLSDYKILLHPIRISIMKIMERSYRISRVDLEKMIGGKRGTFASHLQKLHELELIAIENVFLEGKPRKYVTLTLKGISYYNEFKKEIKQSIN